MALCLLGCGTDSDATSTDAVGGAGDGDGDGSNGGGAGTTGTGSGDGDGDGSPGGGGAMAQPGGIVTYGDTYAGGEFHLGPVDWAETQWHNACGPGGGYPPEVQQAESPGELLAGLSYLPNVGGYCDACIYVTTAMGKSALLRVVTYGDTSENSVDVSPAAFAILDSGEYPRHMTWQFAKCAEQGPILYEFRDGAHEYWTSLWVRGARLPIPQAEIKGANHGDFVTLERADDGTLTDNGGFGVGPFTIRLTATDGSQHTDTFDWPAGGVSGALLTGSGNFD